MSDTPDAPFLPASVLSLVEKIAQILTRRRETVAIAESAAGGLLNAALLSWPGASAFYKGG